MPREIEPPTIQREFLLSALNEGKRLDGRLPLQQRDIHLEFGDELGCVECRLGKTRWVSESSHQTIASCHTHHEIFEERR